MKGPANNFKFYTKKYVDECHVFDHYHYLLLEKKVTKSM